MGALLEQGLVLGIGGTNYRIADVKDGDIGNFQKEYTPNNADDFFRQIGKNVLDASNRGATWAVAGFPGPVQRTEDDRYIVGPFTNIAGINNKAYDLHAELTKHDSAVSTLLENGFNILAGNDGDMAAHAAAKLYGAGYGTVGDVIVGTGVGGAAVKLDTKSGIFKVISLPLELGHIPTGETAIDTFENMYSGNAIKAATGISAEDLPSDHPMWAKVGRGVGKLATTLSVMTGAELVVPSGSVGVERAKDYRDSLEEFMEGYAKYGSAAQKAFIPKIQFISPDLAQEYEMHGAEGIARENITAR